MTNLKKETIEALSQNGKTKEDVIWAGTPEQEIPLVLFWQYTDKEYNDGYGHPEVNQRLVVVGDNWWLERYEYDGSEWWEYKELPTRPKEETYFDIIFEGECDD